MNADRHRWARLTLATISIAARRAVWLWIGVLLAGSQVLAAEDAALSEIMRLLKPVRSTPLSLQSKARGATPAFTEIKHRLRDWIEGQLHEFHNQDEVRALAQELNAKLLQEKLACVWPGLPAEKGCPEREQPGYLGEIKLELGESLIVTTSVGIVCGGDESAYAYSFIDGHWKRFWESETNNYAPGKYVPVNFIGIHLSTRDYSNKDADPNVRLMLALSRDPAYCESNWYNVYYRAWQLRTDRPEEQLLLNGGEEAFFGDWVDSVVSPNDVLIEYPTHTTYTDFLIRPIVRHYVLTGGKIEREAPFALSPRDFVDEWMRSDWAVSSQWTTAGANALTLQRMHRKENFEGGSYTETIRCENRPEHWQVGLSWDKYDGRAMVETKRLYFLVRWLPPYRFSLTAISSRPWAACTEKDPVADEPRTLFPVHSQ